MNATNNADQPLDLDIQSIYSLAATGRLDEAEAICMNLLKQHPDETSLLTMLGTIAFNKGNLGEAKELIEKSIQLSPDQIEAHIHLSTILLNLGDADKALAAVNAAISLANPPAEAWNNRGIILSSMGRANEALQDFDAALQINPEYVEALYNKAAVQQQIGLTGPATASFQQVIDLHPNHHAARYNLAVLLFNHGNHAAALENLSLVLNAHPDFVDALVQRGRIFFEQGRFKEALADTDKAIGILPQHVGALFQKGSIHLQTGDGANALACFSTAKSLAPRDTYVLLALGVTCYNLKDFNGALDAFNTVIALDPNISEAYNNKGLVLQEQKSHVEAIENYDIALSLRPTDTEALYNKANALRELDRFEDALTLYNQLLNIFPDHKNGLRNKAATLDKLRKREEALDIYNRMIFLFPDDADTYFNASTILVKLNKPEQALGYANKAYKLDPNNVDTLYVRALILMKFGLFSHAMADAAEALKKQPDHAFANFIMGNIHDEQKRPVEALKHLNLALERNNEIEFLPGKVAHLRMSLADWAGFDHAIDEILTLLDRGKPACQPFELHSKIDSPEYHKKCSEIFYAELFQTKTQIQLPEHSANSRIHVAYFSSDIGDHPVSSLMAGVFEAHDRDKFEVTLFSLVNHADGSRNRIFSACERTINAEFMTDEEVVAQARSLKVDIAVDLNGFTSKNRTGIFSRRAAPIQINYIGFLGTMGSDCHDYIIGDPVISPLEHERHFSEKIIQLPWYQANDDKVKVPDSSRTRKDFGLPDDAFVFCCFNANYKITPEIFSAWMRILNQVPNSVLWLHCKRDDVIANLRAAACAQGVAGERLVMAPAVPYQEHLARHRLADLFLDTHPYNAGATASNALYCGLPIITYCGKAFCSRYGASLLSALNLTELITDTLDDYIALSVKIASDRELLGQIKQKLSDNLKQYKLFDTQAFTSNLEGAYRTIYRRSRLGLGPAHCSPLDIMQED